MKRLGAGDQVDIIITGSSGMLGTALIEKLKAFQNVNIIAITSKPDELKNIYKDENNIFVFKSLKDIKEDRSEMYCINCAFPRKNDGAQLAGIIDYTIDLIDDLHKLGCKQLINISSQSVYAQEGEEIQTEEDPVSPKNQYGLTKYAVEKIVNIKSTEYGINHINIRLGSLINEQFSERLINRFISLINEGKKIKVDLGENKVSYFYINDARDALIKLLFQSSTTRFSMPHLNLANNDWMTLKDLAHHIVNTASKNNDKTNEVEYSDKTSLFNNTINSDKIYDLLSWSPAYSMKDIIEELVEKNGMVT